jgi:dTDP-4-dehydrorhamnose 3,5-epimerase-like enzyme
MLKPYKFSGNKFFDNRGSVSFTNDFSFKNIKRYYILENNNLNFVRAWHAHKKEEKYFTCISGSCQISCVKIDDFKKPKKNLKITSWVLSEEKPEIVYIPKGYANGSMNLKCNTKILVLSTSLLKSSLNDDYRYNFDYWNPWKIIQR